MSRITIYAVAVLFAAGFWPGCCGSEESIDTRAEEIGETVADVSEESPSGEEGDEPLSDYAIQEMESLRSVGYPVYDKNVTMCSGVTSPSLGEFVLIETSDGKEKVIEFYVAAGGTPEEHESGAVVFKDWKMPVGVRAPYMADSGTAIMYDVLGCMYLSDVDEIEESVELSEDEIETLESLRARGFPVYDNNVIYIEFFDYANGDGFYELHTRDDGDTVVQLFVDAGGTPEYDGGYTVFNDWEIPIYIAGQGPYGKLTIIYYGVPSA